MPQIQVKKVVAVCFLEAVKTTLDHLGAQRLEQSHQGLQGSPDLPRTYGEVRRLRDYLQRCIGAFPEVVDLELPAADVGLLVACCRRSVVGMDLRLTEPGVDGDERTWLQRKRQVVSDWAVELAEKPLLDLPLNKLSPVATEASRALTIRLHNKLFGSIRERAGMDSPTTAPSSTGTGLELFGEQAPAIDPPDADPRSGVPVGDSRGRAAPGLRRGPGASGRANGTTVKTTSGSEPEDLLGPPGPAPMREAGRPDAAAALFEPHKLRDPRLRALAGMDVRTYERLVGFGDHRLATVLLASLLESAVIDYAIVRRGELGLTGSPETWSPQDLLSKALGDRAEPQDRAMAFQLFASRNLLRPALQMMTPAVATSATFERLREFVQRALHELGYGLGASPPGPRTTVGR